MTEKKDYVCRSEVDPLKPIPAKGHHVKYDTNSHFKSRICRFADVAQNKRKWWNNIKTLVENTAKTKKSLVVFQDIKIKDEYFSIGKGKLKKRTLSANLSDLKNKGGLTTQQKNSDSSKETTSLIWSRRKCQETGDGVWDKHTHYIEKRFDENDSLSELIENAFVPLDNIAGENFIIEKQRLTCKTKGLVIHLDDVLNQGLYIQILTNYDQAHTSRQTALSYAEKLGLNEEQRWKGTYLSYMIAFKKFISDKIKQEQAQEGADQTKNDDGTNSESEMSEIDELSLDTEDENTEEDQEDYPTKRDNKIDSQNSSGRSLGAKESSKAVADFYKSNGNKNSTRSKETELERIKREASENGYVIVADKSSRTASKSSSNYKK